MSQATCWLIVYAYRRVGDSDWRFENIAHKGSLVGWLREMQEHKDGFYRLLNAFPISKADHDWIESNT